MRMINLFNKQKTNNNNINSNNTDYNNKNNTSTMSQNDFIFSILCSSIRFLIVYDFFSFYITLL